MKKSDAVTTGVQQAPHRSLFNALGMTKEELSELVIKSREDTIKKMCGKSRKYFIE